MGAACSAYEKEDRRIQGFGGEASIGRVRSGWDDNIKMDFIFNRASNLYLCLCNQLFALYQ